MMRKTLSVALGATALIAFSCGALFAHGGGGGFHGGGGGGFRGGGGFGGGGFRGGYGGGGYGGFRGGYGGGYGGVRGGYGRLRRSRAHADFRQLRALQRQLWRRDLVLVPAPGRIRPIAAHPSTTARRASGAGARPGAWRVVELPAQA